MTKERIAEDRQAGASYVLAFYKEVGDLTKLYAQYHNLYVEFKQKYGEDIEKVNSQDRDVLLNLLTQMRFQITITYVHFKSINDALKKDNKNTKIEELHDKLKEEFILDIKDLTDFVEELNSFLIKDIIKNLLENSYSLVTEMF
jgi:hypothetical protein